MDFSENGLNSGPPASTLRQPSSEQELDTTGVASLQVEKRWEEGTAGELPPLSA